MEKYREIERSIIKTYRKQIWKPFIKALQNYELINENDKIMVCISGGKDSFLMAKCIQELQRHGQVHFEARYVVMDPGYNQYNLDYIKDNAKIMNVPIEIFESPIFDVVEKSEGKSPCYLCARMRRGYLYAHAQKLGCNKIALGHHYDDVIETTLLSMFYGSEIKTMMPKLHSDNFPGLELIRPLYMVKEASIIHWHDANELTFINCACRMSEGCSIIDDGTSKRKEVKELIKRMRRNNPDVDQHIFTSMHNVNLDCIVGYRKGKEKHSFLENYNKENEM
ncbi:MAG: tRNA 2-thiocytidine biosynthesis protein TtcA [Erysipelotrichaceae bacterium]|nr:tRNA 2-thiocytidine biosynthesis protein TtcA [Erysipelotrichaceae bacterium]